ncbi:MAG: hypothetical protein IJ689_01230 [Alphaproteobacteria bacterium]|nr:hypothetical protein [Alphaproteobacteria bacterium]
MLLTKEEKEIFQQALRQLIYFASLFVFIFLITLLVRRIGGKPFNENSIIENIQLFLLLFSGLSFLLFSCDNKDYRVISFLLSSFCFLAACRELDKSFDLLIPVISWKFGFIFPIAALVYAGRNFEKSFRAVLRFACLPSFYMMCLAVMIIIPIAQCIGHRPLVEVVVDRHSVPAVKEFFEEACELVGYFLILMSSLEYSINIKKTTIDKKEHDKH